MKKVFVFAALLCLLCGCGGADAYSITVVERIEEEALQVELTMEPIATESPTEAPTSTPEPTPSPTPTPPELQIVMVGDMLMHERVVESGLQEDGSYNFDHIFANVKDTIEGADLALVNQETILGGTGLGISGYPCFNSPFELGDAEVVAGFDVILHATNHTLDKNKKGVINCMEFWENSYPEIAYLGMNPSKEHQDEYIYLYEQDGITVAILNYTYGTNGINPPSDMPYVVNYLEEDKVISDIKRAEELADFTIVCPHWGTEYVLKETKAQKKWAQIFLENGADLVLGTHPHVIEPVEWLMDEAGKEMLVYYSLGNYINGTSGKGEGVMNRMVGGIADVTLSVNEDGKVYIKEYDAIPVVCHIGEGDAYTVYYLEDYTRELAEENKIVSQAPDFSLDNCIKLVETVWEWRE